MQGIGVRCPWWAAVAEAVAGKPKERHLPNGAKLTIVKWSLMFAMGFPVRNTVRMGNTVNLALLVPIVHFIVAPEQTYESAIGLLDFDNARLYVDTSSRVDGDRVAGFLVMSL